MTKEYTKSPSGKPAVGGSINPRELVLDILYEILEKGGYSHVVLNQALSKYQYLEKQDRAFITRVTEGTLEYLIQIDHVLNQFSTTKVNKMKPLIRTLLRMSVYQILHMDRIPDSAVCNEAVKLAEKRRFQGLKSFVNGVLRSIAREKGKLQFPEMSVRYSMPAWLLEHWKQSYDEETITKMLEYFLSDRPVTVRCNLNQAEQALTKAAQASGSQNQTDSPASDKDRRQVVMGDIIASLEKQGVTVTRSEYAEDILYLEYLDYLEALEAFQKGWIQVQDLSSSLVGLAAAPKQGDVVLDVCGAPGGKSLHIADLLKGTGHVQVRDISDRKVLMIEENIERSGFTNISASVWDALELDEEFIEKADVVIADLPCSGLGIIGRKPDIKQKMTPEDLESLARLQRQMLSVVHQYVKPGGILVYSTCTIDRLENEDNVAWFLEHYPFKPVDMEGRLGDKLRSETMKQGYIQILPGIYPCDGFFISVLQRV